MTDITPEYRQYLKSWVEKEGYSNLSPESLRKRIAWKIKNDTYTVAKHRGERVAPIKKPEEPGVLGSLGYGLARGLSEGGRIASMGLLPSMTTGSSEGVLPKYVPFMGVPVKTSWVTPFHEQVNDPTAKNKFLEASEPAMETMTGKISEVAGSAPGVLAAYGGGIRGAGALGRKLLKPALTKRGQFARHVGEMTAGTIATGVGREATSQALYGEGAPLGETALHEGALGLGLGVVPPGVAKVFQQMGMSPPMSRVAGETVGAYGAGAALAPEGEREEAGTAAAAVYGPISYLTRGRGGIQGLARGDRPVPEGPQRLLPGPRGAQRQQANQAREMVVSEAGESKKPLPEATRSQRGQAEEVIQAKVEPMITQGAPGEPLQGPRARPRGTEPPEVMRRLVDRQRTLDEALKPEAPKPEAEPPRQPPLPERWQDMEASFDRISEPGQRAEAAGRISEGYLAEGRTKEAQEWGKRWEEMASEAGTEIPRGVRQKEILESDAWKEADKQHKLGEDINESYLYSMFNEAQAKLGLKGVSDYLKFQLKQLGGGIKEPGRAMQEGFAANERFFGRVMEKMAQRFPTAKKGVDWIRGRSPSIVKSHDPLLRSIQENQERVSLADRVSMAEIEVAFRSLGDRQKQQVYEAAYKGYDLPKEFSKDPTVREIATDAINAYHDLAVRHGDELVLQGFLLQDVVDQYRKPGSRYVRHVYGPKARAAAKKKRRSQPRLASDETNMAGTARTAEQLARGITAQRKMRDFESYLKAGGEASTEALLHGARESAGLYERISYFREIYDRGKGNLWRDPDPAIVAKAGRKKKPIPEERRIGTEEPPGEAPRYPKTEVEVLPPEGSGWRLAKGKGWGVLRNKWIREDVYGGLEALANPLGSEYGRLFRSLNNQAGRNMVVGRLGTIQKTFGIEGVVNNAKMGVGFIEQFRNLPWTLRTYRKWIKGERLPPEDGKYIAELIAAGEFETGSSGERQFGGPARKDQLRGYRDIKGRGSEYAKEMKLKFLDALEQNIQEAHSRQEQRTGVKGDRAGKGGYTEAGAEAIFDAFRGVDLARLVKEKPITAGGHEVRIGGEGLVDLARFYDQIHKLNAHKVLRTKGPSGLLSEAYRKGATKLSEKTGGRFGRKIPANRPVSAKTSTDAIKQFYDPQSTFGFINAMADVPFVGPKFIRPIAKQVWNAFSGTGARNPMVYAPLAATSAVAAAYWVNSTDDDLDDFEDLQKIAGNGDPVRAAAYVPAGRLPDGSTIMVDLSFFTTQQAVDALLPGQGVRPQSRKMDDSWYKEFVNEFVELTRDAIAKNPAGSNLLEATGYSPYRGKLHTPELTKYIDLVAPTATITDVWRSYQWGEEAKERGSTPSTSWMEKMITQITGAPVQIIPPKNSGAYLKQLQRARNNEKIFNEEPSAYR